MRRLRVLRRPDPARVLDLQLQDFRCGAFYPFVPAAGEQQRETERELVLRAQVASELPIEAELERWSPTTLGNAYLTRSRFVPVSGRPIWHPLMALFALAYGFDAFRAIVLGALQGFSELFPTSSLGHTVLLPTLFG